MPSAQEILKIYFASPEIPTGKPCVGPKDLQSCFFAHQQLAATSFISAQRNKKFSRPSTLVPLTNVSLIL